MFISMFIIFLSVMVSAGFFILFERKMLGYIQLRKGPNKVGFYGVIQPFSDLVKLIIKEMMFPFMSNYLIYYFCPLMVLIISMIMWMNMPLLSLFMDFEYSLFFFMCCSSLSVYSIMIAGWSSNNTYCLLSSIRMIAQLISYEISLFMILFSYFLMVGGFSLLIFQKFQIYVWMIYLFFPMSLMLIILGLAETNRSPFDFAESESELVSGFNIEYSSSGFIYIFMAEYISIIYLSMLFSMIFLGGNFNQVIFLFKMIFFIYLWVWVRGCLPRMRYDKLMNLAWKSFLVISINYLFFYFGLMVMILSYLS
uniref:NADH-ubiquinone oxidoreductase chain 1 n=1 Tax=Syrbatus sp. 2 RRMO-2024a TaxID=3154168 RepID=A0AAU7LKR7_9COLE